MIFGAGFSLAVLFLIKGSVSGIAIGAGSIVLGIAINYSLHFYTHYRHTGSIIQNLKDLAEPMTVEVLPPLVHFFVCSLLNRKHCKTSECLRLLV